MSNIRIEEQSREIAKFFSDDAAVTRAVQKAVRQAVLDHKQAGNPVSAWQDGKVVLVAAKDIVLPEEDLLAKHSVTPGEKLI